MRILGKARYQVALLAAALVVGLGSEASAWSYGSWGSYGSSGSWGSYGSSASYGSYGSGGSYGSYGRLGIIGRIRARHAARHSYGSYGSYGSGGSYGAYSVSYASSGSSGSYGSSGSSGSYGGVIYSEPVVDECADCSASTSTDEALLEDSSAVIEVSVPADATVYVNDKKTASEGASRSYVPNSLQAGQTYMYKFRVEFNDNGKSVVKNETVKLTAGDRVTPSFGANEELALNPANPATTELKLTVPENAKVFLAGAETTQTGKVRTYSTSRLAEGQSWDGYTVRVELDQDGEKLVREEKLTVKGGESYELAFDFDSEADQIAAK